MKIHRSRYVLLLGIFCLTAKDAYGYLDPGSGSLMLQALVASFLGAMLAIKIFWHKIKAFFLRLLSKLGMDSRGTH